jgi:hypothetical protein
LLRVGRPPFATSSAIAVRLLRHRLSHAELRTARGLLVTPKRTSSEFTPVTGPSASQVDSEQFRSAPKVPHASMHKDLSCQRVTSRAFGDKGLFREVSKALLAAEYPPETIAVMRYAGSSTARGRRDHDLQVKRCVPCLTRKDGAEAILA